MKIDILFWNIRNRGKLGKVKPAIESLYKKYKPKMFLLIESDLDDAETEALFNGELKSVMKNTNKSIRLFVSDSILVNEINDKEIDINHPSRQIKQRIVTFKLTADTEPILFFGVHFPSKFSYEAEEQYKIMREWQAYIDSQEKLNKTTKSVFFGDLNLNPFDYALYQDDALYAHPIINPKASYTPLFYNPMWSLMGDFVYKTNKTKIPGSYYFEPSRFSVREFYWNCIDGVLIKSNMVNNFIKKELEILTKVNNHKFADNQEIFSKEYSDHLPIKFQLKL